MNVPRYAIAHFAQSNPAGPGQADVAALLRTVADTVAGLGQVAVQDLLLHTDFNEHGPWPSIIVYYADIE